MANNKGNIAIELANAPIVRPEAPATTAQPEVVSHVPTLPTPVFALVANPKAYEDRNDKSKSNMAVAVVNLQFGAVTLEASIYLETRIEQTAEGRREVKALRFSMPKKVKLTDSIPSEDVQAWKDDVIDAFMAWRVQNGGKVTGIRSTAGYRVITE